MTVVRGARPNRIVSVLAIGALLTCAVDARGQTASSAPGEAQRDVLLPVLARAEQERLHEDALWLRLLHYENGLFGHANHSSIATASFFLSAEGASNPRAELRATLSGFFEPPAETEAAEHPQCSFIARRHWLAERLGDALDSMPIVECPEYDAWRGGLEAKSLSLIFPEGFISNPASMFGHTLLRIDSQLQSGPEELVGFAVDFTAETGDDQGLVFMAKGVSGSYSGRFGVRPYYQQLARYAEWENRDIWEYRLDLTAAQIEFLLMHLWELRDAETPYYFFTHNCSYELLRLLEVAVPELDASRSFHGPVIPIDTVRAIVDQVGFTSTRYRPSPETRLRERLRSLSREDRRRVGNIAEGKMDPADESLESLPPERRAEILDTAYLQLRYAQHAGVVSEADARAVSRKILIARNRVEFDGAPVVDVAKAPKRPRIRPDQAHRTSLIAAGGGWRDGEGFVELRLRPAFHALMDNAGGYPESLEIELLDTRLRIYPESGVVRLQELTVLRAASMSPRGLPHRPWSWSGETGLATRRVPRISGLEDASIWRTQVGAGLSWLPFRASLFYAMADLTLDVGPALVDSVSFGPGARVGLFAGARDSRWRAHFFGLVTGFVLGDETTGARAGGELRYATSTNTSVVVESTANHMYGETWFDGRVYLNFYF